MIDLEPEAAPEVMATQSPTIDLSIIIVSWNVRDLLLSCLASIETNRGSLEVEVIVVDSGSEDDSPSAVTESFPWVTLVAREDNVGFPRGNNIGIAKANGRHLLLLNPDTEIIADALETMVAYLEAHPDAGVVGGQLLNPDGSVQSSRRRFPTLRTAIFESTWLQPMAPKSFLRRYYMEDISPDVTTDVDWLTGACLTVRRDVVDQVGALDEQYFMYSEELDWCRRIKQAGWRVVYVPAAQIVHHSGKSSEQVSLSRHIYFQRAKLRYFRKFHGRASATLLRVTLIMNYAGQIVIESVKGLVGHKRQLRWRRIREYWRVLQTGLRPAGY